MRQPCYLKVIIIKKCHGITESFWQNFPEDNKLGWKYLSRAIGLVMALLMTVLVVKTGNIYVDWVLSVATAIVVAIATETQRSYSKLSPRLRKANVRVLISLGSWGVAFIGIAYFAQTALIACLKVFADDVLPAVSRNRNLLSACLFLGTSIACAPIAVIRVIRQLGIEQMIFYLPKEGLKNIFIKRPYKANSFATFAYFELTLMLVCLMYSSVVVMLVKSCMAIVAALSTL
ncbi:hypothetical protein IP91_00183 [Pseudoduganella lurida]|uniref:Uncharacterized protein n=1 Tax=Pseudoduganella lurida TaxID=1036180 RepID=A0A562RJ69_9BURK|nr:hypothetical protein IP91_00183 [Pseudoduganella lurida]